MSRECFCGCGKRHGLQLHHVVTQQRIRKETKQRQYYGMSEGLERSQWLTEQAVRESTLLGDRRNLVPVGRSCHAKHHSRQKPYELRKLPSSAFEFAEELLGAGPAYEYLRRSYAGEDQRLEALLSKEAV